MATAELEGKTVLLTGATDGLGRALATDLAGRGATLLLHGRDEERGAATLAEVADESGSDRLSWYRADLASLAEVRELAEAVGRDQGPPRRAGEQRGHRDRRARRRRPAGERRRGSSCASR